MTTTRIASIIGIALSIIGLLIYTGTKEDSGKYVALIGTGLYLLAFIVDRVKKNPAKNNQGIESLIINDEIKTRKKFI